MADQSIEIYGAREHNLKNISLQIPHNQLVVITGLSGSGKSSLAFDTLYAEGQRRYIETFPGYARQFLGGLERPDVDKIDGLSPVIAIEQKTTSKSPRSTVGTITELYDFLRLLYARVGTAYSYFSGLPMVSYTDEQIIEAIRKEFKNKKIGILAPLVRGRKGHYRELFDQLGKKGFMYVRVNGEMQEITPQMKLDRYKTHDIELVVDRLVLDEDISEKRVQDAIQIALKMGKGILKLINLENQKTRYFSKHLMDPASGISYPSPEPNTFSFNSPKGACPNCNGIGTYKELDLQKAIPNDNFSINAGAILALEDLTKHKKYLLKQINLILHKHGFDLDTPYKKINEQAKKEILHGANERVKIQLKYAEISKEYKIDFEGLLPYLNRLMSDRTNATARSIERKYTRTLPCEECSGHRLKKESLQFKILDQHIGEVSNLMLDDFYRFMQKVQKELPEKQQLVGQEIIKEILTRTNFLLDVGLNYLSLSRGSKTLSGGEAQRIRLATQIGSQLVNVLYILDEPSIGLHQKDNEKLIQSLKELRDIGNSVIVVEHDKDMMLQSDWLIDLGPKAGKNGGEIIWQGAPKNLRKAKTATADFINGIQEIKVPEKRREGNGEWLKLKGATGNNLQNVNLQIPLGTLTLITGVSGSGKSTLINETLYRILNQYFYHAVKDPLPYNKIEGLQHLDKVIEVDQSPIGRTPRSNPATYTGLFTEIRNLFTQLPESKIRGYKPGRFSFNVKGGRCETCQGAGLKLIEMNFLPDIYVPCESCYGKRFNRETLEVRYKGKSIADVLDMTINEGVEFFEHIPKIYQKLKMLQDVGLGYVSLGQQSTTLSGGEAQRVKLANELAKRQTGKTIYILDEPTTGLHFEDIQMLMQVIDQLVEHGNTVIIIEHNLDVIKLADYIIDIGPEGGKDGGAIIAQGTPEKVAKSKKSYTAKFLKEELKIK